MKKVILTTGGTGGHIYPALAVAKELEKKGVECIFVGTKARMEKDIIPKEGYEFIGLDIVPLNPRKPISFLKMILGILKGIVIVFKKKPSSIIGFGNYISIPMLLAGIITNKDIYLQEQNANIGGTNKAFYRFSKKIFLAFEKTYDDLPIKYCKKLLVTGNPLREEVYSLDRNEEREKLKLKEDEKLLLVTGGSLGAKSINDGILKHYQRIFENKNLRLYWITGRENYDEVVGKVEKEKPNDIIKPYLENMPNIIAAADMIVTRAGALIISEIIENQLPSIMIPYQSIKVGQYENAKIVEEVGGTKIYKNSKACEGVEKALELIEDNIKLNRMKVSLGALKGENATKKIVEALGY